MGGALMPWSQQGIGGRPDRRGGQKAQHGLSSIVVGGGHTRGGASCDPKCWRRRKVCPGFWPSGGGRRGTTGGWRGFTMRGGGRRRGRGCGVWCITRECNGIGGRTLKIGD